MKYSDYVDYGRLNPFKRLAIELFSSTFSHPERLGIKVVEETLGAAAVAFDFLDYDFMLGFNVEGLGTKSLIAEEMYAKMRIGEEVDGSRYYRGLGQDNMAMSINDLVSIGAVPFAYGDILSTGDSSYFDDESRMESLLTSFREGADKAGVAIPLGETPTLQGILYPEVMDLAGASIGIIKPKSNLVGDSKVAEGDAIYGLESSGIHSNGVTLARKIVEGTPDRYFTELDDGKTIGEELLTPTPIYVKPIVSLLEAGVNVHYLSPITGHAFRKIMRPRKSFRYVINNLPEPPRIFSELIKLSEQQGTAVSDYEAYQTWNMGVGYVVIAPDESEEEIVGICGDEGVACHRLGRLEEGNRQVEIVSKGIKYT